MANTYLTRTFGSATSRTKFTISVWLKKSTINSDDNDEKHFFNGYNSSNYRFMIYMTNIDQLKIRNVDNGTETVEYVSNAKYRDVSGWYHVVVRIDTSQGSGDRIRAYVNGEQITSWSSSNEPSSGADFSLGASSYSCVLGRYGGGAHYWNGGMSHYHYCDGQSYAPTEFGETDSTTGEWKIKVDPSVTYGNQGFFMFKNDNSLNDDSGNGNNFSLGAGTLTKTEDCPSNVFATWNPLDGYYQDGTGSNGNTTWQTINSKYSYRPATLGVSSGKFYWEVKYVAKSGGTDYPQIGITSTQTAANKGIGDNPHDWGQYIDNNTSYLRNNSSSSAWGTAFTVGDIVGVALDCTNNKLYLSKNGVFQESGNPSSGSNGISITAPASTPLGLYFPAFTFYDGSTNGTFSANFGNGYFGTTAVSSAGTNASNNGIFEYDVPAGYTALSTKGLNL